jgi:hypothetical protein
LPEHWTLRTAWRASARQAAPLHALNGGMKHLP